MKANNIISQPKLLEKLNKGMTAKAIAQESNIGLSTVYHLMSRYEIKKVSIYPNKYAMTQKKTFRGASVFRRLTSSERIVGSIVKMKFTPGRNNPRPPQEVEGFVMSIHYFPKKDEADEVNVQVGQELCLVKENDRQWTMEIL